MKITKKKKILNQITERLLNEYPSEKCALKFNEDFELLVASRLSAQCTDIRVNAVTGEMFKELRTPKDFAEAPVELSLINICPSASEDRRIKNNLPRQYLLTIMTRL